MAFKSDQILWYNNGIWGELGFAVPNFGNNPTTLNTGISRLVSSIGRNLSGVLCMNGDVDLRIPPSINTLTRIHKLIVRARQIVGGRAVPSGTPAMEAVHATPAPEEFTIFPVPYFKIRNQWLKEYAGLTLMALSEAMQHTDNRNSFDFSQQFGGIVGQYLDRIYRLMATELFGIDPSKITAGFVLTDADLSAYNPSKFYTSTEMIDTIPEVSTIPTEDDLVPLTDGIPASLLVNIQKYPSGAASDVAAGTSTTTAGATTATTAPAFPAAPSP